jgi:lipid-A-disaccharide synthase
MEPVQQDQKNRPNRGRSRRPWRGRNRGAPPWRRPGNRFRTVAIVSGEASGDLHGAQLAQRMWRLDRNLQIVGMGGDHMEKAGVKLFFDSRRLGVMGLVEVIRRWKAVREAYRTVCEQIRSGKVDLVVLIDSPDFNMRVARVAREAGIPTVYYIGPKVWAWRPGRLKTLAGRVDRALLIFPFEEPLYREAGIPCKFVGHPLLDEIPPELDPVWLRQQFGVPASHPVVALLPGSRPAEIRLLLPVMLSAAKRLNAKIPDVGYLLPVAPSVDRAAVERMVGRSKLNVRLVAGDAPRVLACADAAVVASGTATLEAALVGTPMVIVYKMAWLTYLAARLLVRIRHVGLVNIVAGRGVAPELLQGRASGRRISRELHRLMTEWEVRREMKRAMVEVSAKLGTPGASMRAAREILSFNYQKNRTPEGPPPEPGKTEVRATR